MQLTAMGAGELAGWSPPVESLAEREHCCSEPMVRGARDYLDRAWAPDGGGSVGRPGSQRGTRAAYSS